jgi:hypothetical protein
MAMIFVCVLFVAGAMHTSPQGPQTAIGDRTQKLLKVK